MKIIHLNKVDSTNSWLLNQPDLLKQHGLAVYADRQTNGRGRFGRKWSAGQNQHLFCSLVIHPSFEQKYISSLTLLTGLAVFRVLKSFSITDLSIKWPNDILIQEKKVCGILCESTSIPELKDKIIVVVGIGINLTGNSQQYPNELQNKIITLEETIKQKLGAKQLLILIQKELKKILSPFNTHNLNLLLKEWEQCSSSIGKQINFYQKQQLKSGKIQGLNHQGHLIVRLENHEIITLSSGEIIY